MVITTFKVTLIAILFLLPGYIFMLAIFKDRLVGLSKFVLGLAIGLVVLVDVNALLSFIGGITGTSLFISLLILYLVSLAVLLYRRPTLNLSNIFSFLRSWESLVLISVVFWSALIRFMPLLFSEFPLGWDSSFHSLISKIILLTKQIPTTWEPFERIPLNYPWGSHALVSDISLLSGVPIHQVFSILISVFFSMLSVVAVYLLASLFFKDRLSPIMAALAYGLLGNWGSLNYYAWGGLPNQVGMFLLLCLSYVLLEGKMDFREKSILGGIFLSGIVLVHNHSMLVAFYILFFYALLILLAKRRVDYEIKGILTILVLGLVFSSYYSWRFIGKALTAQNTGVFRFKESLNLFEMPSYLGVFLMIFFAIGLFSYQRKQDRNYIYLLSWQVSLFLAFVIFYYIWKIASKGILGESFVALTPSRFITDMVYPISILAGEGIRVTIKVLKKYSPVLLSLFFLVLALIPFVYTIGFYKPALSEEAINALGWIRGNTAKDTLLINIDPERAVNDLPEDMWAPYISERECTFTPLPTTDLPDSFIYSVKQRLGSFVLRNEEWWNYPKDEFKKRFDGRPVYVYSRKQIDLEWVTEKYANSGTFVYEANMQEL